MSFDGLGDSKHFLTGIGDKDNEVNLIQGQHHESILRSRTVHKKTGGRSDSIGEFVAPNLYDIDLGEEMNNAPPDVQYVDVNEPNENRASKH